MNERRDERIHSGACERNRDPILEVLLEVLPEHGLVLEVASGTGMHSVHFAPRLPRLRWQPTDLGEDALRSIAAWAAAEPSENLLPPLRLDVTSRPWPCERADAIFNANMIHISPFECTEALLDGAAEVLGAGAPLVLYGPFMIDGRHTAPTNEAFDESLRGRDPEWGIRDLGVVEALAAERGLNLERRVQMPANNQILVFRR